MVVATVTPIWGRPLLTALFAHHLRRHVREALEYGIELRPIIVGSERSSSKVMAEGMIYVEHPNEPLGSKFNAGCLRARDEDPDYWTVIGSDCFWRPTLWRDVAELLEKKTPYFGMQDLFMWKPSSGQAVYWPGYDKPKPIGPMRFVRKDLMNGLAWRPYDDHKPRGLDASMDKMMPEAVLYSGKEHLFTSVKVDSGKGESLTDINLFRNCDIVHERHFHDLVAQF